MKLIFVKEDLLNKTVWNLGNGKSIAEVFQMNSFPLALHSSAQQQYKKPGLGHFIDNFSQTSVKTSHSYQSSTSYKVFIRSCKILLFLVGFQEIVIPFVTFSWHTVRWDSCWISLMSEWRLVICRNWKNTFFKDSETQWELQSRVALLVCLLNFRWM